MTAKPDFTAALDGLKDFQIRSVDYIFNRLYRDPEPTNRFLLADEVGLGKTMVARGVIAKSLDYLWDKIQRLDIIYICSNGDIARQNVNRLTVTANGFSMASRITLLPSKLQKLNENKVNFVSFTPGTSFNLRSSTGKYEERALIYSILRKAWGLGSTRGPINLMQCTVGMKNWRKYVNWYFKQEAPQIDEELKTGYIRALEKKPELRQQFFDLSKSFGRFRGYSRIPWQENVARNELIGELRYVLATTCIYALKPDIIILDEFQRFKSLLKDDDPMSKLAQDMFNYKDPDKAVPTKVLLLSATPYKMYTMHHESEEEDHYKDFLTTLSFLFNSEERTEEFSHLLHQYRRQLYNFDPQNTGKLTEVRNKIQTQLRQVMIRTERLSVSADRSGMIKDCYEKPCEIKETDLLGFHTIDTVAQALGAGDSVELWKSSPYLLNLMDNYALKKKLVAKIKTDGHFEQLSHLLTGSKGLLHWHRISRYNQVDHGNARLRKLIDNNLEFGWQLLWVPPSLPYYQPEGAYAKTQAEGFTKALVFSSWQVVPKMIASLCSYEAERRMITSLDKQVSYANSRKKYRSLLQFNIVDERYTGMPVLALLYPCLTLAREVDPLMIAREKGGTPTQQAVFETAKEIITELFNNAVPTDRFPKSGLEDERWYWAALALLDRHYNRQPLQKWFSGKYAEETDRKEFSFDTMIEGREETDSKFTDHARFFQDFFANPELIELGRIPDTLFDVLTKFALASPAITSLRSLSRKVDDISGVPVLAGACKVAVGFRSTFNLPETVTLIRSIYKKEPYWERTLDYSLDGNLQAVMDEYVHILYESLGLQNKSAVEVVHALTGTITSAVAIRTTRAEFDDIKVSATKRRVILTPKNIRCRYAMRFQESRTEDGDVTREDQVRTAFNSPFRPFILATTSIGQEGLDFHQYCRAIYHWNLPSNPVDLEQREGRIHRYKGLVIRQNLARHYNLTNIDSSLRDPWDSLFIQAVRERGDQENDLKPFWIFETEQGNQIERYIPTFPMSRESKRIEDLKRTLVLYRMVFGQPRQEDLLNFLKENVDGSSLGAALNYRIDLTP